MGAPRAATYGRCWEGIGFFVTPSAPNHKPWALTPSFIRFLFRLGVARERVLHGAARMKTGEGRGAWFGTRVEGTCGQLGRRPHKTLG